jgi:hypothetical protein
MPIFNVSAARPKQVSKARTPANPILQPIIRFNMLNSRWGIKKSEKSGLFHCGALHRKKNVLAARRSPTATLLHQDPALDAAAVIVAGIVVRISG